MRIRLTLLCLAVTGVILAAATCLCLYFSESGIAKNGSTSFTNSLNSMLTQLESQNTITLQWIAGIEKNHNTILSLFDNGQPLFYQELRRTRRKRMSYPLQKKPPPGTTGWIWMPRMPPPFCPNMWNSG